MSKNKNFGLTSIEDNLSKQSKSFLEDVQKEIVQEEQNSLKDFVKGAYRLMVEKQKAVKDFEAEILNLDAAIKEASSGNWKSISAIKIPARFFEESTLRKHGKTLLGNNEEVRFVDLYVDADK